MIRLIGKITAVAVVVAMGAMFASSCAKPQAPMGKKEVEDIVRDYIKNNPGDIAATMQRFQEDQRKNAQADALKQALSNRANVPVVDSPSMGVAEASITIVEFSDFQCPYCARSLPTIDALMEKYKDKAKLVFKNSPLPFHAKAPDAAKAAMAAEKQGKFWEFRRKLMQAQNEWSQDADHKALFGKYAKELGMDSAMFVKDMDSSEFQKRLEDDMALAKTLGVGGTPTYFINGAMVVGAQEFSFFDQVVTEVSKDKPGA